MAIKTDSGVRRLVNSPYRDVTNETFKEMYPTNEWQARFYQALRITR